jgi:hypothetical protein
MKQRVLYKTTFYTHTHKEKRKQRRFRKHSTSNEKEWIGTCFFFFARFKTPSSLLYTRQKKKNLYTLSLVLFARWNNNNFGTLKPKTHTQTRFLGQLFLYYNNIKGGDAMGVDQWLKKDVKIFWDHIKRRK